MALSQRVPDWGWWKHVPTVSLHEAVALSLNIDPNQLRRDHVRAWTAERRFNEGPEFAKRLTLAKRCLGGTLSGPVNSLAVRYYDDNAAVRLHDFAVWANSVEWDIPPELQQLVADDQRSGDSGVAKFKDAGPIVDRSQPVRELDLILPTGAPGRPSKGMHLIRVEFDRGQQANECKSSLREEATDLEGWFRKKYPTAQPVKRKTIENNIRSGYRDWASDRRSPET